jgi:hypothetical protein
LHRSGDYVPSGKEFSSANCLPATEKYLKRAVSLTHDNWTAIFEALIRLQDTRANEAQVDVGAVAEEEHEAWLPEDPPSPTPALLYLAADLDAPLLAAHT